MKRLLLAATVAFLPGAAFAATGSGTPNFSSVSINGSPIPAGMAGAGSGSSTTVLHGNSSGTFSWGSVNLGTDVAGTLGTASGGTGASTASGARVNLGAAASGANSDLTSIAGLVAVPGTSMTVHIAESGATGGYEADEPGVLIDLSNINNSPANKHGMICQLYTNNDTTAENSQCLAAITYHQYSVVSGTPVSEASSIYASETGAGNTVSIYNLCEDAPSGFPQDCTDGRTLEAAADGDKTTATFDQTGTYGTGHGRTMWVLWAGGQQAILLQPHDDTVPTSQPVSMLNAAGTQENFFLTKEGDGYFRGTFEADGNVTLLGKLTGEQIVAQNGLTMLLSSNATDQKYWDLSEGATTLAFRAVNDAYNANTTYLTVNRGSGYTVNNMWAAVPIADGSETLETSGSSVTVPNNSGRLILDGVSSTYTVTMPAAPVDGQPMLLECGTAVTSLTVSANSGQAMKGTATACSATQGHSWHYRAANSSWYMDY